MKFRNCRLLAVAALVCCCLANAQTRAQNAYIANVLSHNVSVIDTTTGAMIATIPVGSFPWGVAVTPDASKVYVANSRSNNISVIDAATNTVFATIPVRSGPVGLVVTPDGSKVYVANSGSDNISVIATATNMVIGPPIPVGATPVGMAVTPDGSKLYVANSRSNNVSVIATATNMPFATIPVGRYPWGVAVTPDGSKVYASNADLSPPGNTVSVIDVATDMVIGPPITVGLEPYGVAVTPDGSKVYVANFPPDNVSVIATATNMTIGSPIPVGIGPVGVAVTPDGSKVYVANSRSNNVSVIATATNAVAMIGVGWAPEALAVGLQAPPGAPSTVCYKVPPKTSPVLVPTVIIQLPGGRRIIIPGDAAGPPQMFGVGTSNGSAPYAVRTRPRRAPPPATVCYEIPSTTSQMLMPTVIVHFPGGRTITMPGDAAGAPWVFRVRTSRR